MATSAIPREAVRSGRIRRWWAKLPIRPIRDSLLLRFTVVSLIVTALIAVAFSLLLTKRMIADALDDAAREAAQTVTTSITPEVSADDFTAATPARVAAWKMRIGRVVAGDIVRVKVWDAHGTVLYSDDPELIGKTFPLADQDELREALEGHLAKELSELGKSENVAERSYGRLLEIYVPVRLSGGVIGVFEVYRRFDPLHQKIRDIERLVWGGSVVAFGLLYASLFLLVQRASRRLSSLASFPILNPNPVIETTLAGEILYMNPAAASQFPEVRAAGARHPLLAEMPQVAEALTRDGRRSVIREVTIGDAVYEEVVSSVPDVKTFRIYTVDVTERKRAEARIRQQLQRLDALRTIDNAITASVDLRVTLNVVLDQVSTHLEPDATDILLFNPHTQILEYAAGRGFLTPALQHTRLPLGKGFAGRAALERTVVTIPNVAEAPGEFTRAPLLGAEEFVAYAAAPLVAKGQVKGVLEIFRRSPMTPDTEWLNFLEALAGQAAIAIDNAALFDDLQRANVHLRLAYDSTLEGWSRALDLRDEETEGHSRRVTEMAVRLARAMGMSDEDLAHIRRGALLHDIGKMGIPDSILHKPGPLTEDEWVIMRRHPVYAYEMLSPIAYLRPALDIPYGHHERWDGSGYPRGLKGDHIPLAARVFAVVDVYDALSSDRPYRAAWPREKVLAYLREHAARLFDAVVVEKFLALEQDLATRLRPVAATD